MVTTGRYRQCNLYKINPIRALAFGKTEAEIEWGGSTKTIYRNITSDASTAWKSLSMVTIFKP